MSFRIDGTGNNNFYQDNSVAAKKEAAARTEDTGAIIKAKASEPVPVLEPNKFEGQLELSSSAYASAPVSKETLSALPVFMDGMLALKDEGQVDEFTSLSTKALMNNMLDLMA